MSLHSWIIVTPPDLPSNLPQEFSFFFFFILKDLKKKHENVKHINFKRSEKKSKTMKNVQNVAIHLFIVPHPFKRIRVPRGKKRQDIRVKG